MRAILMFIKILLSYIEGKVAEDEGMNGSFYKI